MKCATAEAAERGTIERMEVIDAWLDWLTSPASAPIAEQALALLRLAILTAGEIGPYILVALMVLAIGAGAAILLRGALAFCLGFIAGYRRS